MLADIEAGRDEARYSKRARAEREHYRNLFRRCRETLTAIYGKVSRGLGRYKKSPQLLFELHANDLLQVCDKFIAQDELRIRNAKRSFYRPEEPLKFVVGRFRTSVTPPKSVQLRVMELQSWPPVLLLLTLSLEVTVPIIGAISR